MNAAMCRTSATSQVQITSVYDKQRKISALQTANLSQMHPEDNRGEV